jgi:glycerophosphoryl diester phosphodiesterase
MRSSPSKPDPLDPGPLGFAHRGLHSGSDAPENSLAAFKAAIEFGAGIECDLRLTADNRLVVFHDADARRLCASPLRIGESKWSDLAGLRIGAHPIPTLESLLALVAGRIPLLFEAKIEGDARRWATALKRDLSRYPGRFAVMSFDPRFCRSLKRDTPGVRRGLLVKDSLRALRRNLYIRVAGADFLGVEVPALGKRWVAAARSAVPIYGWTIRSADERAQASVHADALIWESDGRPRN